MLPWQLARFIAPEKIVGIAKRHYKIDLPESAVVVTRVLMISLLLAFLIGVKNV